MQSLLTREGLEQPRRDVRLGSSCETNVPILFFKRHNYKLTVLARREASVMETPASVFDSGASPNLLCPLCLAEIWRLSICSVDSSPLIDASNRFKILLGLLVAVVSLGQLQARVKSLVVANMVDCMLGTTFVDCHVRAIVPKPRNILFHPGPAVALLSARKPSAEAVSDANRTKSGAAKDPLTSRKARQLEPVSVLPLTQVIVRVSTAAAGLFFSSITCTRPCQILRL